MSQLDIRMGTLVPCNRPNPADYIRQISAHGFESYQLFFWQYVGDVDFRKLAKEVESALDDAETEVRPVISSIGIFGNPLEDKQTAIDWRRCIDACRLFGPECNVVAGFAGCITDKPVPESMKQYKKVFAPLARRAEGKNVRIAFENCDMGGTWHAARWNIAHSPAGWEMMFNEIESKAIGLEWEPCHQMNSLVDPLPQLREWIDRVYHIHGKDATVLWDVVKTKGTRGGSQYVFHRTPGFGDTNWTDLISILRRGGFKGAIDIEGWHDPVYRGELEMTGQVHGLNYLKQCRGGPFVPNPV